jgi:CubicO group peptidase (beta-lactamase class C family)
MEDATTVCEGQLRAIGRALDRYEREHGEPPAHLSDLMPDFLPDPSVFHCPADPTSGSPASSWLPADPHQPISYFYELSPAAGHPGGVQLRPEPPAADATWRERKLAQRVHFGDRVPVVTCGHHGGVRLHLTSAASVYRSRGAWEDEPATIEAVLDRLAGDLDVPESAFIPQWSLPAIDRYAGRWIDAPLPPALRYRLGSLAARLRSACTRLPNEMRSAAWYLTGRLFSAAGQPSEALAAAAEALRMPGGHAGAAFLQAELRYRAEGGAPPVDALVEAERERHRIPGISLAVVREGQVVLAKGYGLANVEGSVPAEPDTVYAIYSVTKQFTAAAVMLLVEEGALSLDDPISRHLPDLPPAWGPATVRHLLNHTSGIKSYTSLPDFRQHIRRDMTAEEVLGWVREFPLEFAPGEKHLYNNTGYFLLGLLIEKASGKPYGEYLAERIFRPLGMSATQLDDLREIIPKRASGYSWESERRRNADRVSPTQPYSAGALVSTVEDLARWDAALYGDAILSRVIREQMWTPTRLDDGTTANYGFGFALGSYHGHRTVQHGGGAPGFLTAFHRFPEARLTVIVLTNLDRGDPGRLAVRIAGYYLGEPPSLEAEDPAVIERLQAHLPALMAGEADPAGYSLETLAALELPEAGAFYRSLGPLRSFRLIEQTSDASRRTYRFLAAFEKTRWIQSFVLSEGGAITELALEPE